MYALNTISDLEIQVEQQPDYQKHHLFYKGLLIRTLYWRPANYFENGFHCDRCSHVPCFEPCFVCLVNGNTEKVEPTRISACNLQIEAYRNRLFGVQPSEFCCYLLYETTVLEVGGNILAELRHQGWLWTGNKTKRNVNAADSVQSFKILDDQLRIKLWGKKIILYNQHPFHRQILARLRELKPFSEAPVWLK